MTALTHERRIRVWCKGHFEIHPPRLDAYYSDGDRRYKWDKGEGKATVR